jgi:hypothetical protein
MTFGNLAETTRAFKGTADTVSDVAIAKMNELLDKANETFSKIEALGLSVRDFRVGSGITPSLQFTLYGAIDAVDPDRLQKIIEEHPDKALLVMILKALRTASLFRAELTSLNFGSVEAKVDLGVPPAVSVNFGP